MDHSGGQKAIDFSVWLEATLGAGNGWSIEEAPDGRCSRCGFPLTRIEGRDRSHRCKAVDQRQCWRFSGPKMDQRADAAWKAASRNVTANQGEILQDESYQENVAAAVFP